MRETNNELNIHIIKEKILLYVSLRDECLLVLKDNSGIYAIEEAIMSPSFWNILAMPPMFYSQEHWNICNYTSIILES